MKVFNIFKKPTESISDTITTKLQSPFFATFIIVWIIKNKIFIYDLFFNSLKTDKSIVLNKHLNYAERVFWEQLAFTFGITLGVLLIYYIFLNISRFLTVISEDNLKLLVYKLFSNNRFVDIERHNNLKHDFEIAIKENSELDTSNRKYREIKKNDEALIGELNTRIKQINKKSENILKTNKEQGDTIIRKDGEIIEQKEINQKLKLDIVDAKRWEDVAENKENFIKDQQLKLDGKSEEILIVRKKLTDANFEKKHLITEIDNSLLKLSRQMNNVLKVENKPLSLSQRSVIKKRMNSFVNNLRGKIGTKKE